MSNQASDASAQRSKPITAVLLLLVLLLATGLRFYDLDAQSLWNDEGTSAALAQRDLGTIARDAARDIHPPLYYWLLSGWVRLAGTSETALRSLSALLGVALVALTYLLGHTLVGRRAGLVAAFLAAISPFQVYYSQEARMYMLLAALTAGAMLLLIRLLAEESWPTLATLVVLEAAGLYTHYSFLFIVLVMNVAYVLWLMVSWKDTEARKRVLHWALAQIVVLILYLPWLPAAIRQVTTWPRPGPGTALSPPLGSALADTWRWLVFGPTMETAEAAVPLLIAGVLAVAGVLALGLGKVGGPQTPKWWSGALLVLWAGLPVGLILVLGLYREAYLKFLLVTTPAVSLLLSCGLLAAGPAAGGSKERGSRLLISGLRLVQIGAMLCLLIPSARALQNYYTDPRYARDDYRGISAYVEAVGRAGDAILLNAPGQREVFAYYYDGPLPVFALPEDRPLRPEATEAALRALATPGRRLYTVLWATDESDPDRFIEGWLDDHSYKASDWWYGNVRLAVYAIPEQAPDAPEYSLDVVLRDEGVGDEIRLVGYSVLNDRLEAGDIAQITLFWQAERTPAQRYKVFLHALDDGNQIVGQRDAEPGGGARLTTLWPAGETIADNHGLPIHPATPPGRYRVEVGMYRPETGQRLTTAEGTGEVWLEPLTVVRPATAPPQAAMQMEHDADAAFGDLTLLGYDAHKLGFAGQDDVRLQGGDLLHVNLYWRAETEPGGDWRVDLALLDPKGQEVARMTSEPVRGFPTSAWKRGDVWRGQFNLTIPGGAPAGEYRIQVQPAAPDGPSPGTFLSDPLQVGP